MLYGTSGCHLCEQAEAVLMPLVQQSVIIECVDVADDDDLLVRFGTLIPVLESSDGRYLQWPFDLRAVEAFLAV